MAFINLSKNVNLKQIGNRFYFFQIDSAKFIEVNEEYSKKIAYLFKNNLDFSVLNKNEPQLLQLLSLLEFNEFIFISSKKKEPLIKKVGEPALDNLFIQINTICNLKCNMCYLENKIDPGMSKEKLIKLIDEASEMGVNSLSLSGGEAFLRPDIFEIIEYAKKKRMNVSVFSNGILLNEEKIKQLKSIGLNWIAISMDSYDANIHDQIRGKKGSFEKTSHTLELLKKYKIHTRLNMTITKKNQSQIKEYIYYFVIKYGITDFAMSPIILRGQGESSSDGIDDHSAVDAKCVYYKTFETLIKSKEKTNMKRRILLPCPKAAGCGIGYNMIHLRSNGEANICPTMTSFDNKIFDLGNYNNNSLLTLWKNLCDKFYPLNCKRGSLCKYWNECAGGCRDTAFRKYNNLNACDTHCMQYLSIICDEKELSEDEIQEIVIETSSGRNILTEYQIEGENNHQEKEKTQLVKIESIKKRN